MEYELKEGLTVAEQNYGIEEIDESFERGLDFFYCDVSNNLTVLQLLMLLEIERLFNDGGPDDYATINILSSKFKLTRSKCSRAVMALIDLGLVFYYKEGRSNLIHLSDKAADPLAMLGYVLRNRVVKTTIPSNKEL